MTSKKRQRDSGHWSARKLYSFRLQYDRSRVADDNDQNIDQSYHIVEQNDHNIDENGENHLFLCHCVAT